MASRLNLYGVSRAGRSYFVTALLASTTLAIAPANAQVTPTATTAPGPPADQTSADQASADQGPKIADIIVTAQKRVQKLQDVPVSVTVVSGATIAAQNFRTLQDLSRNQPTFTITPVGRGVRLALRGVSSGTNSSFDQSVVTFIDDVYHGKSRQSGSLLLDIDSIELLKGPQTAFFGNNAIAGAVNVQTAKPTMKFEGSVRALYGSQGEYATEAVANVPLTSTLAVRAAGLADGMNGYLNDRTGGGYLPHERNWAGRLSLLWAPTGEFKLDLKAEATRNRNRGGAGFQVANCPPPAPFTSPGLFCPQVIAAGGDTQINNTRDQNSGQYINLSTQDYVANASYNFGESTLTSVTAYNHFNFLNTQDLDGSPQPLFGIRAPQKYKQFSQELRIASNGASAPISYIAGVYYQTSRFHDNAELTYNFLSPALNAAPPFAALRPYLPLGQSDAVRQKEETISGFGSLTWHITDKLSVTAGARATRVKKDFTQIILYGQSADQYGDITPYSPSLAAVAQTFANRAALGKAGTISLSRSDSQFTPTFNVQYKVNPNVNVYASYTEGFKAGGFNGGLTTGVASQLPFGPEHVRAYEIGLRSELFDRRLLFNVTAFKSDYTNLQQSIYAVVSGVPLTLVQNAAASVSQGIEVESKLAVTSSFSVGASLTFLDSHFKNFPNAAPTVVQRVLLGQTTQDLAGRPLAYAPKFAGLFYAEYDHPLNDRFDVHLSADLLHQSRYFTADQDDPNLAQGSYYKLDLGAAIRTADKKWEFSVIGKNVANVTVLASAIDSAGPGTIFVAKERPRSVVGQVRYKW